MKRINRLTILCFYEEDGYVDLYVYHLVEELLSVSTQVVIVVNGYMEEKAKVYFERCNCIVLIRENEGYDAKAYKYVFEMLGRDKIKKFDQIVLCNDSFFGPFIPMKDIFDKMETRECDFWGLSYQDTNLFQFIASYLLVFREKTIQSDDLWYYFESMPEIVEYQDALIRFELYIFLYFKERGYIHDSLVSKKKYFSNVKYPYENLKYEQLPILKKRAFTIKDNWKLMKAIKFIQNNYNYDINLIQAWMERKKIVFEESKVSLKNTLPTKINDCPRVTINEIYDFIDKWKNICIYGNGYFGHILIDLYQIKPQFIIISERQLLQQNQYRGIPIKVISQIDIKNKETGIIVALNRANTEEVKKNLGNSNNVLYLWGIK